MEQKRVFKVTKKLSGEPKVYRKWNEWAVGDVVVGTYDSTSIDKYKKNNYSIRVAEAFFKDGSGKSLAGKILCLNANGMLDNAMADVEIGAMVQVEYKGKSLLEKGPYAGSEAHTILVEKGSFDDSQDDSDGL